MPNLAGQNLEDQGLYIVTGAHDLDGFVFWRVQYGHEYLIHKSCGAQKSLGPRSPKTEAVKLSFDCRKSIVTERLVTKRNKMGVHAKLNRIRALNRADSILVDVITASKLQACPKMYA